MKNKKLYLAYGSNLNINQMIRRCPDAKVYGSGELKDYSLKFAGNIENAYTTIEKNNGENVPCGVWEITQDDEKRLDKYEGYPKFYTKELVDICIDNKELNMMVYVMNPKFEIGIPSEEYIKTIRDGYEDFGLDAEIFDKALMKNMQKVSERLLKDEDLQGEYEEDLQNEEEIYYSKKKKF